MSSWPPRCPAEPNGPTHPNLQFDIFPAMTFVMAPTRHRLRSCGLTEAPSTLRPATVERPVTGRRVRQVQRAAFLHSVQVDHGIERLSRIRDHVDGPVPDAGEPLSPFLNRIN
jgi:hypothetical protein